MVYFFRYLVYLHYSVVKSTAIIIPYVENFNTSCSLQGCPYHRVLVYYMWYTTIVPGCQPLFSEYCGVRPMQLLHSHIATLDSASNGIALITFLLGVLGNANEPQATPGQIRPSEPAARHINCLRFSFPLRYNSMDILTSRGTALFYIILSLLEEPDKFALNEQGGNSITAMYRLFSFPYLLHPWQIPNKN